VILGRAEVARLLPHAGAMCMLDSVVEWDDERIVCHSDRHRAPDNPLRADARLAAIHAIEFAAQAMAIHHRLMNRVSRVPRHGLLVSVRQCTLAAQRLDDAPSPLVIEATRVAVTDDAFTYRFTVGTPESPLVTGRASVLLVGSDA